MTTRQAAEILDVTAEAVRKMVKTGRLEQTGTVGRMLMIDADSVHRVRREGKRAGRLWTEQTAWAALFLLSGQKVTWLSSSELWRLRKKLASISAEEFQQLVRNRSTPRRFRGSASSKAQLSRAIALTGSGILGDYRIASSFGLAAGTAALEGYAKTGFIDKNARKLGLREDASGDILIRELNFALPLEGGHVPTAAIAADLQDAHSTRERSAGRTKIEELLHAQ
ncbi:MULTISPECIES: helix-turn-helix domain-containing protein [Glutamicibacter]|uniref:helix-turn-helix domain-containing protein n=1 Tax=Glutamicibacter TaxID=1742989 RepID=UPI001957F5C1|nr:helix-turn-helix domain-containing protein [Glutamicibacter protophormiae]QRQ80563.1 helix-turn-helix domain-containing protein [Glutamicibacter protophormiae]